MSRRTYRALCFLLLLCVSAPFSHMVGMSMRGGEIRREMERIEDRVFPLLDRLDPDRDAYREYHATKARLERESDGYDRALERANKEQRKELIAASKAVEKELKKLAEVPRQIVRARGPRIDTFADDPEAPRTPVIEFDLPAGWKPLAPGDTETFRRSYAEQSEAYFGEYTGKIGESPGIEGLSAFACPDLEITVVAIVSRVPEQDGFLKTILEESDQKLAWGRQNGAIRRVLSNGIVPVNGREFLQTDTESMNGGRIVALATYLQETPGRVASVVVVADRASARAGADAIRAILGSVRIRFDRPSPELFHRTKALWMEREEVAARLQKEYGFRKPGTSTVATLLVLWIGLLLYVVNGCPPKHWFAEHD